MEVTAKSIEVDIATYQQRIDQALSDLQALPEAASGWAAQKGLDKKRRALLSEISHVERLLRYAEEALRGLGLSSLGCQGRAKKEEFDFNH